MSVPTNVSTMVELGAWLNGASAGVLYNALPFVIWIIFFLALKQYTTLRAALVASFVTTLFCLLLRWVGLVSNVVMSVFIIALALTAFALALKRE